MAHPIGVPVSAAKANQSPGLGAARKVGKIHRDDGWGGVTMTPAVRQVVSATTDSSIINAPKGIGMLVQKEQASMPMGSHAVSAAPAAPITLEEKMLPGDHAAPHELPHARSANTISWDEGEAAVDANKHAIARKESVDPRLSVALESAHHIESNRRTIWKEPTDQELEQHHIERVQEARGTLSSMPVPTTVNKALNRSQQLAVLREREAVEAAEKARAERELAEQRRQALLLKEIEAKRVEKEKWRKIPAVEMSTRVCTFRFCCLVQWDSQMVKIDHLNNKLVFYDKNSKDLDGALKLCNGAVKRGSSDLECSFTEFGVNPKSTTLSFETNAACDHFIKSMEKALEGTKILGFNIAGL